MSVIKTVSKKAILLVFLFVCLLFLMSCNAVVYSKNGCCICKKVSKEKIFFPSENCEHLFTAVFGIRSPDKRSGFICRACYMAIKKWEKTKETSQMVSLLCTDFYLFSFPYKNV
jgi:hypothetical protein